MMTGRDAKFEIEHPKSEINKDLKCYFAST